MNDQFVSAMSFDVGPIASGVLGVLAVTAVVGVVLALATDDREPSIVLAWLFVILLVPVLGIVAYFFIGRDHRRATRRRAETRSRVVGLADELLTPATTAAAGFTDTVAEALAGTVAGKVESTGRREAGLAPLPADSVRVYTAGADKFRDLLADMRSAQRSIHLMYLIWEQDDLTAEVTEILLERMSAGVQVHVLYDWLSSLPYGKKELTRLAKAGAVVAPCYKRLSQLNYRNHMKMAIVDSATVYSGGMNMGQEYIDGGKRFATWRDTHFRLTGPVVAPYMWLFATIWLLNGRTDEPFNGLPVPAESHASGAGVPAQVLHSSVSTDFPAIRDVFIVALGNAQKRVWIQSPYFIPDEPLLTAMSTAATSGVDVRFMMTGLPDKKVPFYAAQAYFPALLEAGVRVYQYKAGFLHSKTVTVDDDVSIIGTCNWDIRSIILHDEVVAVFYDGDMAAAAAQQYKHDLDSCTEITVDQLAALGSWARLRNSVYRLFSRLL
jgi:cardiolipin synthase